MSIFESYFFLELKRMIKTVPMLVIGMIVFTGLLFGIATAGRELTKNSDANFEKISVAIVGKEDDKYTKLAISAFESMETVKVSFEVFYCTREEAEAGLENGTYMVMLVLPDDYVDGFMHGENKQVELYYGKGQDTMVAYIMRRLTKVITDVLISTEKNIYSVQDFYEEKELEGKGDMLFDINLEYVTKIYNRNNAFVREVVDATDGLPMTVYYLCDALVLIFLLLGLQCSKLLKRNDYVLEKKLRVAGVGATKQIMASFGALLICFGAIFALISSLLIVITPYLKEMGIIIGDGSIGGMIITFLLVGLILIPTCSTIMFVYELVNDNANGVFGLFLVIIVLGFMGGCFYPLSYLPMQMQVASTFTITRAMFCYVAGCIDNDFSYIWLLVMLLESVVLLGANILIRRKRG